MPAWEGAISVWPRGASRRRAAPTVLAEPTRRVLSEMGLLDEVGVVEIDPTLSDTAATLNGIRASFLDTLANCVVVGGRREGIERLAACVVLATTRVDVNRVVKRLLDVRKASFPPMVLPWS